MKRTLNIILLMTALVGCKDKESVSPEIRKIPCVSDFKDLRRMGNLVQKVPVLFAEGRLYYLPHPDSPNVDFRYATPFVPCNLPKKYQKDTLGALISGYHLTNDFLVVANVIPLPFELTKIELRN